MRRAFPCWLLLLLVGCSGSKSGLPLGGNLRDLPYAGSGPLAAMVPERASFAWAMRDPQALLQSLEDAPGQLFGGDAFRDLAALPPLERWHSVQDRLSELARLPLPALSGLLEVPALVAYVPPAGADGVSGWLYLARLDASKSSAWAFAEALNVVRPSGRDVEVDRVGAQGLPVRNVSVGAGHLSYALLADRLIASSEPSLAAEAVGLALQGGSSLGARQPFSDLEARAAIVGSALALLPKPPVLSLPGMSTVELDGLDLQLKLDDALWRPANQAVAPLPGARFSVGLDGLDVAALVARLRGAKSQEGTLFEELAPIEPLLGRGVFAQVVPLTPGLGVAVDVLRKSIGAVEGAGWEGLADILLDGPGQAQAMGGGQLRCSENDEVCLAICPAAVRLAWPGSFAREVGCPTVSGHEVAHELSLDVAGAGGEWKVDTHGGQGQLRWEAR